MPNPYAEVHRRLRARQPRSWGGLLAVLAAGLSAPLAQPVLLGFLDGAPSPAAVAAGTEAIAFRVAAVIVAALSLHTYADLVRGPDREVLDVHPVQARPLLWAIALRTARQRLYLPLMGAVLLSPMLLAGQVAAWAGASALALGAWIAGLGVGFSTHLLAVWAAFSPGLARVLDLLRGDNPRMQAALIYAPGAALLVAGLAVGMAASALAGALQGWTFGWAFLLLPPAVGLAGAAVAGPLADAWYVPASALLAEIDAAWASQEQGEEDRRVYLEWLAGEQRPELLRALRQGWRRLRTWPTGAWGLGGVGAIAAWSRDPATAGTVLAVSGAAVALIAAIPTRLVEGDPGWLDQALGVDPRRVAAARAAVGLLYAQGAILPAVVALGVRHGAVALPVLLALELLAALASALAAGAAWRYAARSTWIYAPLAVLCWAAVAGLTLIGARS